MRTRRTGFAIAVTAAIIVLGTGAYIAARSVSQHSLVAALGSRQTSPPASPIKVAQAPGSTATSVPTNATAPGARPSPVRATPGGRTSTPRPTASPTSSSVPSPEPTPSVFPKPTPSPSPTSAATPSPSPTRGTCSWTITAYTNSQVVGTWDGHTSSVGSFSSPAYLVGSSGQAGANYQFSSGCVGSVTTYSGDPAHPSFVDAISTSSWGGKWTAPTGASFSFRVDIT